MTSYYWLLLVITSYCYHYCREPWHQKKILRQTAGRAWRYQRGAWRGSQQRDASPRCGQGGAPRRFIELRCGRNGGLKQGLFTIKKWEKWECSMFCSMIFCES